MKSTLRGKLTAFLTVTGVVLVVLSVVLFAVSEISKGKMRDYAKSTVLQLYSLMPEVRNSVPDDRNDMTMASFEIDGNDFVAVIEVPLYGAELPVYGAWETKKVSSFPCRYTGSMYDGSLIIGGSDNEGQFDFMKIISNGDTVLLTDMTGMRFSYAVTDIRRTKDVSTENLSDTDSDLVLFARNTYSLDYTVVRCTLKNKMK